MDAKITDTRSVAYQVAAKAGVDHRPVEAWLRGQRELPRGRAGERIAVAARELGVTPAISTSAPR